MYNFVGVTGHSSQTWCFHMKCYITSHFCSGGINSVNRSDCEKQAGKLLRLLSQLRPRIRSQQNLYIGARINTSQINNTEYGTFSSNYLLSSMLKTALSASGWWRCWTRISETSAHQSSTASREPQILLTVPKSLSFYFLFLQPNSPGFFKIFSVLLQKYLTFHCSLLFLKWGWGEGAVWLFFNFPTHPPYSVPVEIWKYNGCWITFSSFLQVVTNCL